LVSECATYGTILVELAYTFLIWQRRTRVFLLVDAIVLHIMFAILMGLFYFSFVMCMGHMSFVRPEWLTRLGLAWKQRIGEMEMIYDGHCGFCVRSMAWFLAYDGLAQIKVRNFRTDPSPMSATRRWKRRFTSSCPTVGAAGFRGLSICRVTRPGCGGRFRSSMCQCSAGCSRPIYNWIAANGKALHNEARLARPQLK
jgi:hypothetical protein